MAIDSAEKRRSASSVFSVGANVTPNASKDKEWRYQVGWMYSGNTGVSDISTPSRIYSPVARPGSLLIKR